MLLTTEPNHREAIGVVGSPLARWDTTLSTSSRCFGVETKSSRWLGEGHKDSRNELGNEFEIQQANTVEGGEIWAVKRMAGEKFPTFLQISTTQSTNAKTCTFYDISPSLLNRWLIWKVSHRSVFLNFPQHRNFDLE